MITCDYCKKEIDSTHRNGSTFQIGLFYTDPAAAGGAPKFRVIWDLHNECANELAQYLQHDVLKALDKCQEVQDERP